MKRLILIFLLCFCFVQAQAKTVTVVVGGAPAAAGCTTYSADASLSGGSASNETIPLWSANAKGQSFKVTQNGSIKAVSFHSGYVAGSGDIVMRVGKQADLNTVGSTVIEKTLTVSASGDILFEFDSELAVTTDDICYWALKRADGNTTDARMSMIPNAYADGNAVVGASSDWNMTSNDAPNDFRFVVYLCD